MERIIYEDARRTRKERFKKEHAQNMDDIVKLHNKGSLIIVSVIPNSKKIEITGIEPWRKTLKVKLTEPAKENRANKQLKEIFSDLFEAEPQIISGEKSTIKKIYVPIEPEKIKEKLKKSIKNPEEKTNHP